MKHGCSGTPPVWATIRELAESDKLTGSTRIWWRVWMLSCRVPHGRKMNSFGCMLSALGALLGAHSLVTKRADAEGLTGVIFPGGFRHCRAGLNTVFRTGRNACCSF
jgi:hypothetical protein